MARLNIINYQASWDFDNHKGIIRLQTTKGSWSKSKYFENPNEFTAIVDLLRNERPIFYNTKYDRIETSPEIVGENE